MQTLGGSLAYTLEYVKDAWLLRLFDDVDIYNVQALRDALDAVADGASCALVIVSLEACRYIDASVIGALLQSRKRLGYRFRLVVPLSSRLRLIFDIVGLVKVLALASTLEEALAATEYLCTGSDQPRP